MLCFMLLQMFIFSCRCLQVSSWLTFKLLQISTHLIQTIPKSKQNPTATFGQQNCLTYTRLISPVVNSSYQNCSLRKWYLHLRYNILLFWLYNDCLFVSCVSFWQTQQDTEHGHLLAPRRVLELKKFDKKNV